MKLEVSLKTPKATSPKVAIHTHGCKLNQADSQVLARQFQQAGSTTGRPAPPRATADDQPLHEPTNSDPTARQHRRRARRNNPTALVVATGCYAQRAKDDRSAMEAVSLVLDNRDKPTLVSTIATRLNVVADSSVETVPVAPGRSRAMVKIQEGCDQVCAYCIVPKVRGRERSIPPEEIIAEINGRADSGCREAVLTGTQLGTYGFDLPDIDLPELLRRVLAETNVDRLRVSSLQAQEITPQLLDLWDDPRLCPHFHIPLQSGSDTILRAMRRRYDPARLAETIEVETSAMLRWSPHVLYTNVVEPILRWTFVKRNYALIHGACIANGGDAYLATAKTDTGKTTTVLKVLNENAYSFLSDDLTLLSPDGHVLSYPKPLTISLHTVAAVSQADLSRSERWRLIVQSRVHSRSGRLFANFLARTRLPVATINALIQMIIPPPKYGIKRLIPGVDIGRGAKLRGMFVLERGEGADIDLSHEEALDTLMANTEDAFGFPPYAALESFLQRSSNGDLRPAERTIVSQGLANCSTRVLRRSSMNWWEDVASTIAAGPPRPPEHLLTGTAEQAER